MRSNPITDHAACFSVLLSLSVSLTCGCSSPSDAVSNVADASGPGTDGALGNEAGSGDGGTTCGNGKVDPGENCDGSNINGSTCASLGYEGGALKCSASCQFDPSACGSAFTTTIVATRSTCTAPCAVFFDATTTVGLTNNDYVGANFNWDFDSTNADPKGLHEKTIGFVTAHVFEVPGTYQVVVRARDVAGKASSTTIPITVTAMTGTVVYVASNGSDGNNGSTMKTAMATPSAAFKKYKAPQTSILLRQGDTFDLGNTTAGLPGTGPLLVGSYLDPSAPSSVAPILLSSVLPANGGAVLGFGNGTSDVRLIDLHIKATAGAFQTAFINQSTNTLIERVEIEGIGSTTPAGGCVVFQFGETANGIFIVDSHFHDFIGYGVYADRPTHFAVVGSVIEKFTGLDHGIRVQGGNDLNAGFANDGYVADTTIVPTLGGSYDSLAFRGDDTNIVEVNNTFGSTASFTPQNLDRVEHISQVLFEGNTMNLPSSSTAVSIRAQHVVVRNNLLVNAGAAVGVVAHPLLPANFVDQISVYNNTIYNNDPMFKNAQYGITVFSHQNSEPNPSTHQPVAVGSMTLQNNIVLIGATNSVSKFIDSNGGTITEDHNLSFAPNISGTWSGAPSGTGDVALKDPKFVSTDLTNGKAFRLSTGSPAIDVGTMTPAFQDLTNGARPVGAGWDLGAFEFSL